MRIAHDIETALTATEWSKARTRREIMAIKRRIAMLPDQQAADLRASLKNRASEVEDAARDYPHEHVDFDLLPKLGPGELPGTRTMDVFSQMVDEMAACAECSAVTEAQAEAYDISRKLRNLARRLPANPMLSNADFEYLCQVKGMENCTEEERDQVARLILRELRTQVTYIEHYSRYAARFLSPEFRAEHGPKWQSTADEVREAASYAAGAFVFSDQRRAEFAALASSIPVVSP